MREEIQHWIKQLQLEPHPEGGYYREVYRSSVLLDHKALNESFEGDRSYCTSIYFLIADQDFSALHRIKQDEIWHFYDGTGLTVHVIDKGGKYSEIHLGRQVERGECLQAVVPAGNWFGASVTNSEGYALVGCTVAPGFDFRDFEMPKRSYFLEHYPQHEEVIKKLTRG